MTLSLFLFCSGLFCLYLGFVHSRRSRNDVFASGHRAEINERINRLS